MAQISGVVPALKRYIGIAAITSSISASSVDLGIQAGAGGLGADRLGAGRQLIFASSSIASASCNGGADRGSRSGCNSIHTTRLSTAASLRRRCHAQGVGTAVGEHQVWAAGEPCSQGAKSSEKQPSRIA